MRVGSGHVSGVSKDGVYQLRRTNIAWAFAIYQNLTHHGYTGACAQQYNGLRAGRGSVTIHESSRNTRAPAGHADIVTRARCSSGSVK
jgi:hypothetical protein